MPEHDDVCTDPACMLDDLSSGFALRDFEARTQPRSDCKVLSFPQSLPSMAVVPCDIYARGCLIGIDHGDEMHVCLQAARQLYS